MKILHTDYDARHPWPEGLRVQGGKSGLVIRPVEQGGNYGTAFVECFPAGTFLRGEGPVLAEAEDACWARYQRFLTCAGDGEHGPFEPGGYENGSGFCVRCGTWFSRVCAPSVDYEIAETACNRVTSRFGPDIVVMPQWRGLVADEKARIWAAMRGEAEPVATTVPPTPEELAEYSEEFEELQPIKEVAERVRAFLFARAGMPTIDREIIAGVGTSDGILDLYVADLEALVCLVLGSDTVTSQSTRGASRLPDGLTWGEVHRRERESASRSYADGE